MDLPCQVPRCVEFALDERLVDDEPGRNLCELRIVPTLDRLHHRLEVALHIVHSDREGVLQREVFAVFGEHRREVSGKGQVFANEDPVADGDGQPE